MRYIIFSRVSTNMQDTQNQLFEVEKYVEELRTEDDEVFHFDEKEQSTKAELQDRPVFKQMLDFIKKGDTVVVYKLNRLARGHELALIHYMITKKSKANIVSLYEKDINDELIHAYALVGAFERKNIRDNTITALKKKQAMMEKVGATWYGYDTDPNILQTREKVRSTGKPYKLIPNADEQMMIATMVDLKRRGYSYGDIERFLGAQGYQNRRGKPVQKMTIYRILQRIEQGTQVPIVVSAV